MLVVFQEKRPTICFICLGELGLPFNKHVYSFASLGDLTKHFKQKHLANCKKGDRLECKVYQMSLDHKMHLQNHASRIHRTVSLTLSDLRREQSHLTLLYSITWLFLFHYLSTLLHVFIFGSLFHHVNRICTQGTRLDALQESRGDYA
jgi:hypothetical protein